MDYPGRYDRNRRSGRDFSRVDVSNLFGESPDVLGIKTALEKRALDRNNINPYFTRVVRDAGKFKEWSPEKRLANAITVAAYLVAQGLKTNQVRKILEMARTTELKIKRGDGDIKDDIVKMRYLLAYTVGKASGQSRYPLEAFHNVLDPMLEVLMREPTNENFGKFYDFLQAVVAYHRFFGGRE
ncbi:MAG: type III-A CRISPR-associated protein Csm2 [Aquificota bacterium]|nr:MAG: type III-A CRISPR-associated protein Csm2 [Aquificota bacterium]